MTLARCRARGTARRTVVMNVNARVRVRVRVRIMAMLMVKIEAGGDYFLRLHTPFCIVRLAR